VGHSRESYPEEEIMVPVGGWTSPSCQHVPPRRQECCREEQGDAGRRILPLSQDQRKGCAAP